MRLQLSLALRYLTGRPLRTTLTTLAVVLGVALFFGLSSIIPAFVQAIQRGALAAVGEADLTVTHSSSGAFGLDRLAVVRAVPGVGVASPSLRREVVLPVGAGVNAVTVVGLDPATAPAIRDYRLTAGRFLAVGDDQAIVLPSGLASELGLNVGDTLSLPAAEGSAQLEVVGITTAMPGQSDVYMPLAAAQRLVNQPDTINTIEVVVAAGAGRDQVEKAVQVALGEGYRLAPLESGGIRTQWVGTIQQIVGVVGLLGLAMGGFIIFNTFRTLVAERRRDLGMLRALGATRRMVVGLILVEGVVQGVIGSVLGMALGYAIAAGATLAAGSLLEELMRTEIGAPGLALGLIAQSLALGLGITLVGGVLPALSATKVTPLEALRPGVAVESGARKTVRRQAIAGAALILVAAAGLASGSFALGMLSALLVLIGLVLVAPALVRPLADLFGRLLELVFAREGAIARSNLVRQPGRAAVTASTVMISLAIILTAVGVFSSVINQAIGLVDSSLGSDFLVMPPSLMLGGGNVGAAPTLADEMRALPGVGGVTTVRMGQAVTSGESDTSQAGPAAIQSKLAMLKGGGSATLQVVGIDPVTYPQVTGLEFVEGDADEAYAALTAGGGVIINRIGALQAGVGLGDLLRLETPNGPREYRVVAIGLDFLNMKLSSVFISQADLARDFGISSDLMLMANVAPGADSNVVRAAIQGLLAGYPAFSLTDASAFKAQMEGLMNKAAGLYVILIVVMGAPALIALVNTLAIGVLERRREIGMLRAVGSTRRQVRRMIGAESLLLAALGTAFGILAGLWLGYALTQVIDAAMLPVTYHFPYAGLLAAVAVGLVLGVVAAVIPARQAARLQIVTALRYE
jgi:putative ABC transport system permease protein